MESRKVALVVGANGVIGTNLISHLQTLKNWEVIGLSRRRNTTQEGVRSITVDLLNRKEVEDKLAGLDTVTHMFYVAYQDKPSWAELVAPNMTMLRNVAEVMEQVAPGLQHISFMQGYKVYGAHLGPFKTPAKESDPPIMPPEFMTEQQRYIEQLQVGKGWTWSAIRPSVVSGFALGNPLNLALVIAVYAAISKELNIPFRFPGKRGSYHHLMEMTDAGLLAKATVWAATEARCANQAFNINNGDLFRWEDMWPKIGAYFGLQTADPVPLPLAEVMQDKEGLWKPCGKSTGLAPLIKRYLPGHSAISFFPGITISWPMVPGPGAWVSGSMWIPKKCSSGFLMS